MKALDEILDVVDCQEFYNNLRNPNRIDAKPYSSIRPLVCKNCTMRDDKWFMMKHPCKNNINNKGGSKLI